MWVFGAVDGAVAWIGSVWAWGMGFRIQGSGFEDRGSGFGVPDSVSTSAAMDFAEEDPEHEHQMFGIQRLIASDRGLWG